jgi:cobalt-precorrin-5B (C1)-methyltransferase
MDIFPDLPEVSFVEVGDFTGAALRKAVEHGIQKVVFVGMAGKLTKLAAGVLMTHYTRSKVDTGLLGDITRAAGGAAALADEAATANTARHAYELWAQAGILEAAGAELCDRAARVLARFCDQLVTETSATETSATETRPPDIDVIMVDFSGKIRIASS